MLGGGWEAQLCLAGGAGQVKSGPGLGKRNNHCESPGGDALGIV